MTYRIVLAAGAIMWILLGATILVLFGWSGWVAFAACVVLAAVFALVAFSREGEGT
jgi:hypothetical protein